MAGIHATPKGRLNITAPVLFGRKFVMPGVVDYLQCYPEMQVSTMFLDRSVNLLEEGLDVGIRIGKLADSAMHAVRIGSVRIVLCASPAYLAEYGEPDSPEALRDHHMIASMAGNHLLDLRFQTEGREKMLQFNARLKTNTNDSAIEAATRGYGITRLLSYQLAEHIESGRLKTILKDWEPEALPVNILYREGRQAAAKVRSFVDLMAERLRADSQQW